ncbi:MAG: hypothetical protein JNJ85_11355 [Candidatus Kapabacteria bacterium]|nr:hypothetical protein [Candidatus Kapabacteria bacterium]
MCFSGSLLSHDRLPSISNMVRKEQQPDEFRYFSKAKEFQFLRSDAMPRAVKARSLQFRTQQ